MTQAAVKSPCRSCHGLGQPQYPSCADDCQPLNDYLYLIGDKPHQRPDSCLHLVTFESEKYNPHTTCSIAECEHIRNYLNEYKAKTGLQFAAMARRIGVTVTLLSAVCRGAQLRIGNRNYETIMEWIEKTENART